MKHLSKSNSLKRIMVILFLVASIYLPVSVSAAGTGVVSVSAPGQPVSSGTQFTVNISVQPNNAIAGVQFNLSFNPALVTVNSISEGNLLKQNGASTYFSPGQVDNNSGTISGVAGAITTPGKTISTSGTFAVITFTAKPGSGICSLSLSGVIIGDINGQAVPISTSSGQVSVDRTPVLNAIGNKTVNEGVLLTFTLTGSDPDGDSLTYSATNLPPGANFNAATRVFSWTPSLTQAGSYTNIHFQVTDGTLNASEDITITVVDSNQLVVNTVNASSITKDGVTLSGNLNSLGNNSSVALSFEYGLTTSYGSIAVGNPGTLTAPGNFTAIISGLNPSTLYHYRAKGTGSSSVYGVDLTFTTLASVEMPTIVQPQPITGVGEVTWTYAPTGYTPTTITINSADGKCTVIIDSGTLALADQQATPLGVVTCKSAETTLPPPFDKNVVAQYELGPSGATFDPAVTVIMKYDPASLPTGVDESSLGLAYYNTSTNAWVNLGGIVVDEVNHTISGKTNHFTTFGFISGKGTSPATPTTPVTTATTPVTTIDSQTTARFTVSELKISSVTIDAGHPVNINVTVTNTGDSSGSYDLVMTVNGQLEATKTIVLSGKSNETVALNVIKTEPGTYTVKINDLVNSFTVREASNSSPKAFLTSIIPSYYDRTGELISAKIYYQVSKPADVSGAEAMIDVGFNGEPLESIKVFSVDQTTSGNTPDSWIYIPSDQWKTGTYSFAVELLGPDGTIYKTEDKYLDVVVKEGAVINWSVLLIITALGFVISMILTVIVVTRKRRMYHGGGVVTIEKNSYRDRS